MARPKKKRKGLRENGVFEYKATIGHTLDGKRIRKSFYSSKSLADAKAQAEQYKADQAVAAAMGEPITPKEITFAEWSRKWLHTYKQPFVSPSTYRNTYKNCVENHLIPYFGAANLSVIRPADVQGFFAVKKECSHSLLEKLRMTLIAIFEAAIDNDLLYKNPAKYIKIKSEAKPKEKNALTDAQIELVKSAAKCKMPEVIFLLETGLRRGELLGLMWSDIDLKNGTAKIQRSISVEAGKAVVRPPKWDSFRTIPLMPSTIELLRSRQHISLYVFPAQLVRGAENPNNFSRRLRHFFSSLPEECQCSAHELRHSYASQLMRRGVNIYTISKLLGHRDIKVTSQTYVHPDVEAFRSELSEKFGRNMVVLKNNTSQK